MLESKKYDKMMDKDDNESSYKYLIKMPMDSVTEENVCKLNKEYADLQNEIDALKNTTINKMWLNELKVLKEQYLEYKQERMQMARGDTIKQKKVVTKSATKKVVKKQLLIED